MSINEKIENLKGKLIVSCQALPNETLHSPFIMGRMALAESVLIPRKILRRFRHR